MKLLLSGLIKEMSKYKKRNSFTGAILGLEISESRSINVPNFRITSTSSSKRTLHQTSEIPMPERSSDKKKKKSSSKMSSLSGVDTEQEELWNLLEENEPGKSNVEGRSWHFTKLGDFYRTGSRKLKSSEKKISVFSYNVLSDVLMNRHPELYKDKDVVELNWEERWPRILKQITDIYKEPDILCLQEVQFDYYETHFLPDLRLLGYEGLYKKKTGDKVDGCAIFYKLDKFELDSWWSVEYRQGKIFSLDRDNIALIARFKIGGTKLVVATTHLLFNPKRNDVRLAQSVLLLAELDRVSMMKPVGGILEYYPTIVAGDFNLTPGSPVFHLWNEGYLDYSHLNRKSLERQSWMTLVNVLDPKLFITDHCQHFDTINERLKNNFEDKMSPHLYHSQVNPVLRTEVSSKLELRTREDFLKVNPAQMLDTNTGCFSHAFGFRCVPRPMDRKVTTKQRGWVTVDYIFYSTKYSLRFGKYVEGRLKLLSYLENMTESQALEIPGGLPSIQHPSDHFCLVANFLLTSH